MSVGDGRTFDDFTKAEAEAYCSAYASSLDGRLAWFLDHVPATGGCPRSSLDGSPASLELVGDWVLRQTADVGAPRDGAGAGVELPMWADLDPGTRQWGPQLLLMTDGLVAYRAHCYRTQWPDTYWRVHDGRPSDVDFRQPMLWIDGGRGRTNLQRTSVVFVMKAVIDRSETDPGRLRRVWENAAPKPPTG